MGRLVLEPVEPTVFPMLSDRPYMRADYPREKPSVVIWMIAALVGAYILQLVLWSSWLNASSQVQADLALNIPGLAPSHIWTFATFWLIHDPKNLFHLGLVVVGLYTVGKELEPIIGSRRFFGIFALSLFVGALCWTAVNWRHGGSLIGSTAGVLGLLVLCAARFPDREFSFLMFFVFPVTLTPKLFVLGLLAIDLFAFTFYDVLGNTLPFSYAPSAHLGGMLAGWMAFCYLQRTDPRLFPSNPSPHLPNWIQRKPSVSPSPNAVQTATPARSPNLRIEVDRILDKINSHGFAALNAEEKRLLAEAKNILGRR